MKGYSSRLCPRCRSYLQAAVLEGIQIDHCVRHCGTFLDRGELKDAVHPILDPSLWDNDEMVSSRTESTLLSPVDQSPMETLRFDSKPPLEIDRCKSTGGIWLDEGECEKLYRLVLEKGQDKEHPLGAGREQRGALSYLFQLFSSLPLEVWHPTRTKPLAMLATLVIVVGVFIVQILGLDGDASFGDWLVDLFALHPDVFSSGWVWQLLTYGLLHGGFAHLFGNGFMLYLYGDNVEDVMGPRLFLELLIVSTIAGGVLEIVMGASVPIVGLSGGIAGILGAYFYLFPKVKIRFVFAFIVWRFPAWVTVAFWGFSQFIGVGVENSGVAYWCHIGGFAAGYALAMMRGGFQSISQRVK